VLAGIIYGSRGHNDIAAIVEDEREGDFYGCWKRLLGVEGINADSPVQ
jgi:hypothetical protein